MFHPNYIILNRLGAGCVQLWIRSAEPPGEHRYENRNNNISYREFKDCMPNSVDQDVAAHDELPPLDAYCLQIQLFYIFWCFKC